MLIPFMIKIPIKKLQKQHDLLVKEAFNFFNHNKVICYDKINEAEKIATKIQHLKKYIPNH